MSNEEIKKVRTLLDREIEIDAELADIRQRWNWDDYIALIHELNKERMSIDIEVDKIMNANIA